MNFSHLNSLLSQAFSRLLIGTPRVPAYPSVPAPSSVSKLCVVGICFGQLIFYTVAAIGGFIVWISAYWFGSVDPLRSSYLLSLAIEGWSIVSIVLGVLIVSISRRWAVRTGIEWGWMGIRLGIFVLSILFVAFLSGALDFPANISLITSISLWIPAPIFLRFGFQAVQSVMSLSAEDFVIRPKHHLQGENIIFVSYRREDSQAWADRIADDLKQSFGSKAVFQDVEAVPPGRDFREHLRSQLARCQLMLVVMGPEWVGAKYTSGSRRLDDEQDWVRVEIEIALQRSLPIIPVLAGKATMPSPESLPAAIRPLAFKTALPIRANPDFRNDMDRLIKAIDQNINQPQSSQAGS